MQLLLLPPWVDDQLFGLVCIEMEIVATTPGHEICHLAPVCCLGPTSDQPNDCSVIRKVNYAGVVLGGDTVISEECVQKQYLAGDLLASMLHVSVCYVKSQKDFFKGKDFEEEEDIF